MKIKKMEVGEFNLKKYIFLYIKGHLNNGLTLGQIEDMLKLIVYEVTTIFLTRRFELMCSEHDIAKEKYPYIFDKNGEQIGCKEEDYKDD